MRRQYLLLVVLTVVAGLIGGAVSNWLFVARIAEAQETSVAAQDGQEPDLPKGIVGKDGAEMVLIPAGEFQMGSNDGLDDEKPVHTVYLDAFYMDKYEVTNALYGKFMDATGHKAPGFWNFSDYNAPDHPVVGVTWDEARLYCEWAGKRLPTEAEWEKAARGGLAGKRFPWGDNITRDDANYGDTGGVISFLVSKFKRHKDKWHSTAPVGSFAPNGYGLYDMAGNAWEWCADWYDESYYTNSPKSNPTGPNWEVFRLVRDGSWDGSYYANSPKSNPTEPSWEVLSVVRGGSWDGGPRNLRVAMRFGNRPSYADTYFGFRCVSQD